MEVIIMEKYGCQIVSYNDKLYIRFDEGEILVKYVDYEISQNEAIEAMNNEESAYQVCLKAQLRNIIPKSYFDDSLK
jgi:hypothetical protein